MGLGLEEHLFVLRAFGVREGQSFVLESR
jgi:hypothetical protein